MRIRWRPININLLHGSVAYPPEDTAISVGRAVVRESGIDGFSVCYVTAGVVGMRSLVRVIREGMRINPQPGQSDVIEMLKAVPTAVETEEVREGFECSLKISGFDLKPGDVIEAVVIQA